MTYGERLKYVRQLRHMTQAELGLACGPSCRSTGSVLGYR